MLSNEPVSSLFRLNSAFLANMLIKRINYYAWKVIDKSIYQIMETIKIDLIAKIQTRPFSKSVFL